MNNILFRSNNSVDKDNYKIISLLTIFLIFKIFYVGIYPFINGYGNLYLVFSPLIIYFIYYFILIIINKKSDSYYIVLSLIISFVIPSGISLYVFILGSVIGNIISYIFKNRISSVVITLLLITIYLSNNYIMDSYNGIFYYIYILQCTISYLYLFFNKLVKPKVLLFSFMSIIIINIITNNYIFDISLFCLLFVVSDNRYSPITKYGQILGGFFFGLFIYVFKYIFNIDYYLSLGIFLYEIVSNIINFLGYSWIKFIPVNMIMKMKEDN